MATITANRKIKRDYKILETLEAGIELKGYEVKAVKTGKLNLAGSFVIIKDNQVWLTNAEIAPYQPANTPHNYDPLRTRRLLLSAKEIKKIIGKIKEQHLTIVPIKVYTKGDLIKVEIGLAKGKKEVDKREEIKRRDLEREIGRRLKR